MAKNKGISIGQKRKFLREKFTQEDFKVLKTIQALAVKSGKNPDALFDNLVQIISNKGVLFQAMGNIQGKEGALTKGTDLDPRTVDESSSALVDEISRQLKDGSFRFKPIRRVYMDKSGKSPVSKEQQEKLENLHKQGKVTMDQMKELKARPLGISSFPDKIVQEAMRMVLSAIYEPIFARLNVNFGFRPKMGCQDAIESIQKFAKQMDYAIEGDIKGAFDNVCHDILIHILRKKIKDEKFLKLVKSGLKCGVIFLNYRQDSDLGTTQGSVVSPLLYNVYFHEFDEFIKTDFRKMVDEMNVLENRKDRPVNTLYNSLSKKKTMLKLNVKLKNYKEKLEEFGPGNINSNNSLVDLKKTISKYKELDKRQKKVPAFAKSRQTIRFFYTRYADDWVFFTNASFERVLEWKQLFVDWIKEKLELTVSVEKTRVTNLRKVEYVKFLGYQLSRQKGSKLAKVGFYKSFRTDPSNRIKKKKVKVTSRRGLAYTIRTTNPTLIVTWDRTRILPRLESNGFIRKVGNTWRGKSKLPWTTLTEPEIIQRYNDILRGYIHYYTPVITYPVDIQFLVYLLTYSCAHTLAQKGRCSLKKIFKKYGKNITINYIERTETLNRDGVKEKKETKKQQSILSWKSIKKIMLDVITATRLKQKRKESISLVDKAVDDICNVKINWRTKYKLQKHCSICGSEEKVEYHHVKHIKIGKVTGFLQIMKHLNRRQIPCCKECHKKIHRGDYDGIALKDVYDEELIII